ncbi:MAG TPA: nucleoside triphosphate pyrophosphatase [Solirubrobacterales bacterium]|nr:nucleoside triphosphate pyrophosphatase [Solirubrobacterales bacterium]
MVPQIGATHRQMRMRVTLASGSPQRKEILEKLGIEFEVVVPGVEELTEGDPEHLVVENARRKAEAVEAVGLVIACDTDVVLDGEVLGKPADELEAREYLDRMSGRAHTVMSGMVVTEVQTDLSPDTGDNKIRSGVEKTTVVFKQLSEEEKERYVRFREWEGRSGGYAIQTLGSTLVERLEGSVSNVVGLPVGLLAELAPQLFE